MGNKSAEEIAKEISGHLHGEDHAETILVVSEAIQAERSVLAEKDKSLYKAEWAFQDLLKTSRKYFQELETKLAEKGAEIQKWREGKVTEEMLRKNDGFIAVGNGCEIAVAGTTAQLLAQAQVIERMREALESAHHGDKCASRYNTGKDLNDPRFNCDCFKQALTTQSSEGENK